MRECVEHCSQSAIALQEEKAVIDFKEVHWLWGVHLDCSNKAIDVRWNEDMVLFQKKMVEYALAALHGKKGRSPS